MTPEDFARVLADENNLSGYYEAEIAQYKWFFIFYVIRQNHKKSSNKSQELCPLNSRNDKNNRN